MKTNTFEYPDYFARFYDVIYHKVRAGVDTGFFLKKIKDCNGKVLEIGAGTGRFFIDALNQGVDIYGIDISPSMTGILKSKLDKSQHFRIITGDAGTMKLDRKFDLIVAPFRVFSHVQDTHEQIRFLNNVYDHLNDNGRFIFDLFVPDPNLLAHGMKNVVDFEGEYEPGKKLKRICSSVPDIVNQLLDVTMRFEWEEKNTLQTKEWNFKMRFFFRFELEYLVKFSKLNLETIYGDYSEGSLDKNSKDFVVVCSR